MPKDEIEIVKNLNIIIAMLHGQSDEMVNADYIKTLPFKTLWKNGVINIPDADHLPFLEQPQSFNKILTEFCNDC